MSRRIIAGLAAGFAVLALPGIAFAHVVVTPAQVDVAKYQMFSVGVPTEKNVPTVALKLLLPSGVQNVSPTVKPGWQISTKKPGSGDSARVSEIDWTGGSIPAGFRDEFTFSAQAPAAATTLQWRAYQTYQDGSVVAWDETPGTNSDNPYSTTKVVNDLGAGSTSNDTPSDSGNQTGSYVLSGVALALAIIALLAKKKK